MRKPIIAGNWKMHKTIAEAVDLVREMRRGLNAVETVESVVCPPYIALPAVADALSGTRVGVGAQNMFWAEQGAYTGEIAPGMLEGWCQYVILGHSERRQYHVESDELVAAKLGAAVAAGLSPIVCVGETREQRESGEAESVVASQLRGALDGQKDLAGLVIAYEPVWAIGTGLTASPEQAQDMHAFIRACLEGVAGIDAAATRVLYGGSVKAGNAAELFARQDIDGALVGGAALNAGDFLAIISAGQA